jgi:hypothetical protein
MIAVVLELRQRAQDHQRQNVVDDARRARVQAKNEAAEDDDPSGQGVGLCGFRRAKIRDFVKDQMAEVKQLANFRQENEAVGDAKDSQRQCGGLAPAQR